MNLPNHLSSGKKIHFSSSNWIKWMTLSWVACLLLFPQMSARADIGPKPTMEFIFLHEDDPALTILEGTLLECEDAACTQATPLEDFGPQGFSCTADRCSSMAYGYSEYHRLVIHFSDGKVRESNIFGNRFFDATYQVTVRADDLIVEEDLFRSNAVFSGIFSFILWLFVFPVLLIGAISVLVWMSFRARKEALSFSRGPGPFILSWTVSAVIFFVGGLFSLTLPLTVLIETILAAGYAKLRQRSMLTVLTIVFLINSITQPLLLLALTVVDSRGQTEAFIYLLLLEILIWLGEAVMFYFPQRKEITFKEALGVSLMLNATSFLVGLVLRV